MTTKTLIAAAALAFIGTGAFAQEATQFDIPASQTTRAAVKAELAQARQNGVLVAGEAYGTTTPAAVRTGESQAVASLQRVDVKRDLVRAQADGSYLVAGEAYGTVQPGQSLRTRAEVRAEAMAAARTRNANDLYGN